MADTTVVGAVVSAASPWRETVAAAGFPEREEDKDERERARKQRGGEKVERSLLVTGFGYDHDDAWATNIDLFREFTDVSRGVRRLGAAAVDMCHVALGIVEAYWEYRLKPWDMAAGVLMVEEAGGAVSRMDGGKFCVFDRSVLVSNGVLHEKIAPNIRINLLNMLFLDSLPTKKVFYAMILIYIRFVSRDVILHEMHIVLQITMILSLHPLDQFWHCFLINLQN
nr:phosphatase IMPL1, chloroplastic isoform X7 [Arachis hypogaea]